MHELIHRQARTIEEALLVMAVLRSQEVHLGFGFYPFGDHFHIQRMSDPDQHFDQRSLLAIKRYVLQEAAVDLNNIDGIRT
ncbi:MAG: hypothetical protein R3196_02095 [Pseudidiomarina sp.]|nr:hypothetical protein [Pseudidiomarina sp.]MDX1705222.1 hypothetical protein [Pseudidiomarina sp.]